MVHEAAAGLGDVPRGVLARLAHLILSHHGSRDLGSPVEPMTVEAFILSAADDLDATIHQVRRHLAESSGDAPFTAVSLPPRAGVAQTLRPLTSRTTISTRAITSRI